MSAAADHLRSRLGRILYRELPEEYRYRDTAPAEGELGDLEAYLHGFGHVFDLMRETVEQAHADSFAEPLPDGRGIQAWILPYLAELLGGDLTAPEPRQRAAELNNAVAWYKSKGTLSSIDSVGDVVAGVETVAREGWRYVATTPRVNLPPFTLDKARFEAASETMTRAMQPQGTPDFRKLNRAVVDPEGSNPLFRLKAPRQDPEGEDVYWMESAHGGVPCFPLSYSDTMVRSPDLRDPEMTRRIGPHPRRTLIHVRPPDGVFHPGLPVVVMSQAEFTTALTEHGILRAQDLLEGVDELRLQIGQTPATMPVNPNTKTITLPDGDHILEGLRIVAGNGAKLRLRVPEKGRLTALDCAIEEVSAQGDDTTGPALDALDCIFDALTLPNRLARMEYCTVMGSVELGRIQASDCVFRSLGDTLICPEPDSDAPAHLQNCVRFSRFDRRTGDRADATCLDTLSVSNTTAAVTFVDRWFGTEGDCEKRISRFGEPGYGVLDTDTPAAVTQGAEDEGEMGVGHRRHHAAALAALSRKLEGFLPLGQEIAIFYDPMLARTPPRLAET